MVTFKKVGGGAERKRRTEDGEEDKNQERHAEVEREGRKQIQGEHHRAPLSIQQLLTES